MEIDEKFRINQKDSILFLERLIIEGSFFDVVLVNILISEMIEMVFFDNGVLELENFVVVEVLNVDEESREKKGSVFEGEVENQNGRVFGEFMDNNDDKENVFNNIRCVFLLREWFY